MKGYHIQNNNSERKKDCKHTKKYKTIFGIIYCSRCHKKL